MNEAKSIASVNNNPARNKYAVVVDVPPDSSCAKIKTG